LQDSGQLLEALVDLDVMCSEEPVEGCWHVRVWQGGAPSGNVEGQGVDWSGLVRNHDGKGLGFKAQLRVIASDDDSKNIAHHSKNEILDDGHVLECGRCQNHLHANEESNRRQEHSEWEINQQRYKSPSIWTPDVVEQVFDVRGRHLIL